MCVLYNIQLLLFPSSGEIKLARFKEPVRKRAAPLSYTIGRIDGAVSNEARCRPTSFVLAPSEMMANTTAFLFVVSFMWWRNEVGAGFPTYLDLRNGEQIRLGHKGSRRILTSKPNTMANFESGLENLLLGPGLSSSLSLCKHRRPPPPSPAESSALPSSQQQPTLFESKYTLQHKLQSGSYGTVYVGYHNVRKRQYAVKVVSRR